MKVLLRLSIVNFKVFSIRIILVSLFISHHFSHSYSQQFDYRKTVVYQIYPRSFCDSNNDGIGDINGIISKLDYLQKLGIETIWISPFFESPQADFGYDISHFRRIAPEYGTLEQVDSLIAEVHKRGLKIVFDMVMNHTSNQHEWFKASSSPGANPYSDFYVWAKGKGKNGKRPPNNWKSMIGGSGWHYHPEKKMWYWACFLPFQPDLNYRNPAVKDSMFSNVRFWLDKGVDGFRLDIFNAIYEDEQLRKNPFSLKIIPSEKNVNGFFQQQIHQLNHPQNIVLAEELRAVLDEYPEKFMVGEVFGNIAQVKAYTGRKNNGLNLVFLFESLSTPLKVKHFKKLIHHYEQHFSDSLLPTWVFGNHDRMRRKSVLKNHEAKSQLSASLQMTLRGVPFLYYGEEIGMEQSFIKGKNAQDPLGKMYKHVPHFLVKWTGNALNRDECRTPMQWNSQPNAGFSTVQPWLPVHENYPTTNVFLQENQTESTLEIYKKLLHLRRQHEALSQGAFDWDETNSSKQLMAFYRIHGDEKLWIVHNFSKKSQVLETPKNAFLLLETAGKSSPNEIKPYATKIFKLN
jgi:alpha-glucosidase